MEIEKEFERTIQALQAEIKIISRAIERISTRLENPLPDKSKPGDKSESRDDMMFYPRTITQRNK